MKKSLVFMFFLLFLFTSCHQEEKIKINLDLIDGCYQLETEKTEINLNDYIEYTKEFVVIFNNKEYSSSNLIFNLIEGKNTFLVKNDLENITINIIRKTAIEDNQNEKEIFYEITLLNDHFEELSKISVKENEYLSLDSFKINNIPDGYSWNGKVRYSNDSSTFIDASIDSIQVNNNLCIIPIYEPNEYEIELHFNDSVKVLTIKTGELLNFKDVNKQGYTFLGWYSGDLLITEDMVYSPDLGQIFSGLFKINTYTLTYNYLNETKTVNYKWNDQIKDFIPNIDGYTFEGWYLNDKSFNGTLYNYDENITLMGKFSPKKYKIIYNNIDQTYSQTVTYDDLFTLYTPSRDGFTFSHWEYNGTKFSNGIWNYLSNITLSAVWIENKQTITLNLETFGGKVNNIAEINNNIISLPSPTLKGYTFKYWCWDSTFSKKVTTLSVDDYHNETLYAYYEYDSDDLKGQIIVTMYNAHATEYNELTMFDSSQSGFTSKYWHKIAVKKNNDNYYISGIASSGESISTLGNFDYVILAYSNYPAYNQFVNLGYSIGDTIYMLQNPENLTNGKQINIISFVKSTLGNDTTAVEDYLASLYNSYQTVNNNINLISNYNGFNINWISSNRNAISNTGIYTKPYTTRYVTLSAYIGENNIYDFTVRVDGINSTSTALATGYIYTPYNTITQNAMNTLDIIYCAFLEIDAEANWTNLSRMTTNINNYIKPKALLSGTKIVISVNQSSSGAFAKVAANSTLREKLATNILDVIQTLGLDGVDIDWETPTSSEAPTFTLLMEAIYKKVKSANPNFLVTAAIGGGKWQPPKYDLPNSIKYLDYVNLMTYSLATGNGYYQNSLFKSTKGATLTSCSIEESIKIYNDLNVPNNKILVGIPFYTTVQTNSGGPGSKIGSGKSIWYKELFSTYKLSDTMKEYFDEECGVPYRYDAVNKIFISFDNEESIKRKCEYINTLGLAGIMYWQYGQDVDDMLSNAIDKYINK